ncbi:hypothetical protein GTR02_10460 [Kineococcus sp. R8]|uniref:hypothetical protein n=1 Tax=Kineococcus siccus TaxID=2696567 RepID=UPI001412E4D0|nr:hypothetical protein [Kineococcus siccus]NAZ82239.1 hypothetical protein [Kineococcus siccus]
MSTPTGSDGAHAASGGAGRGDTPGGGRPDFRLGREDVDRGHDRGTQQATTHDPGPSLVHHDTDRTAAPAPSTQHDHDRDHDRGRGRDHDHDRSAGRTAGNTGPVPTPGQNMDRKAVVEREKDAHGGVKVGSAFFGWLTATGTAVLLTALLAATGTAVGLANSGSVDAALSGAESQAAGNAGTIGIAGAVALLVVLLVAYFCGGYVAGRMARFNGVKQGVAVWVWAVVIAVVAAVLVAVAGSRFNVLSQLNSFPRIPVDEGTLTSGSIITVVAALVVALVGAILGGLAGMRFHRRVDRAGLGR